MLCSKSTKYKILYYIIWIDSKINNDENLYYKLRMEKKLSSKALKCVDNVSEAIEYLKELKFVKTIIICSGRLFPDFIKIFKKDINEFMLYPKIIIFTGDKSIFYQNLIITKNH